MLPARFTAPSYSHTDYYIPSSVRLLTRSVVNQIKLILVRIIKQIVMNKTFLKFGALIVAGLVFVGCSKDDNEVKTTEPEFPTEYSELTVEQNKTDKEDNSISLVNSVTTLKNASGIQTSIAFSKFLDGSTLPDNISGGRVGDNESIRPSLAAGLVPTRPVLSPPKHFRACASQATILNRSKPNMPTWWVCTPTARATILGRMKKQVKRLFSSSLRLKPER